MKRTIRYIGSTLAAVILMFCGTSCSEDEDGYPIGIDYTTITTIPGPGQVTIKWTIPDEVDYYYVEVDYDTPEGHYMKTASVYSDSLVADNLLARYGEIVFTVCTVKRDGSKSASYTVSATAEAAEATIEVTGYTQLSIAAAYTDAQESTEGPIENLIDGDTSNFFHMSWSSPTPFPHYIVLDLGKEVSNFRFNYVTRNNTNNDNPATMNVYGSNTFDEVYDPTGEGATLIDELDDSVLPSGAAVSYTSGNYILDESYRYLWFEVLSSWSGDNWIALAEMTIYELTVEIDDPEAE